MSIENQIPTEIQQQTREISFDELIENKQWLRTGDIISDIPDGDGLNQLESFLVDKTFRNPLPRHSEILHDPLQRALKPKGFHGELVNCSALVLPTPSFGRYSNISGTKLLISGDLKSSGRGVIRSFIRPVTYRTAPGSGIGYEKAMTFVRKIESHKTERQVKEMVELLNVESADIAHKVAAFAIRHTFSGGAPTLGKR